MNERDKQILYHIRKNCSKLRERFDYTEWRKLLVDSIDTMDKLDEFVELSKEKIQFNGNPKSVI